MRSVTVPQLVIKEFIAFFFLAECRSQDESYGEDHVAGNVNPVTVTATVVTDTGTVHAMYT